MSPASLSESWFAADVLHSATAVHISLSLIHRLGFDILEAVKSLPARGLEIGGILLGRVDETRSTVFVEDYEPVESEHERGPSYQLSPRDLLVFEQAISRRRNQPDGELRPVGCFRSQTRAGLNLDGQDRTIACNLFHRQPAVCLLVMPTANSPGDAKISVWGRDAFQPVAEFPFEAAALLEGGFPIVSDAPPPPVPQPEAHRSIPSPQPAPMRPQQAWFFNTWFLLGAAAAMLFAAFVIWSRQHPALPGAPAAQTPPAAHDALALNVERREGTAILTWNRNSDAIQNAQYALLEIEDGPKSQRLRLDRTELDTGRVVYAPGSADISFRLRVVAAGGSSVESVRSLGAAPDAGGEHLPVVATTPVATPPRQPQRPAIHSHSDPDADEGDDDPPPRPTVNIRSPAILNAAANRDKSESVQPAVPAPPKPEPFPQVAKAEPDPPPAPSIVSAARPEVHLMTSVSIESLGKSGLKGMLSKVSPERIFRYSDQSPVLPVRIARQVQPQLSAQELAGLRGVRQVDVKVTVGRSGEVLKTELKAHDVDDGIAFAVVRAARESTFVPARSHDGPVEQQALLHFQLRRAEISPPTLAAN